MRLSDEDMVRVHSHPEQHLPRCPVCGHDPETEDTRETHHTPWKVSPFMVCTPRVADDVEASLVPTRPKFQAECPRCGHVMLFVALAAGIS